MTKKDWQNSLRNMQKILIKKKKTLKDHKAFMEIDIEELEFVIECYKQKI